jgi:ribosomal protein S18 acetylase RimI-like enzyme
MRQRKPPTRVSPPEAVLTLRRYQPQDNDVVKELHYAGIAQMMEMVPEAKRIEVPPQDVTFIDSDLDDIEGAYINNRGDFLVGLQDNEIVVIGAVRRMSETCGEIKRLRVRREYQRRGYGEAMMRKLIERARELGYRELLLDTSLYNPPAHRLFEKCGFKEASRGKIGPYDLIIYKKKLNERGE